MTRPRGYRRQETSFSVATGQLMDIVILHANKTERTCAPMFSDTSAGPLVMGLGSLGAIAFVLMIWYIYRTRAQGRQGYEQM